jgi:hypothetical protein
VILHAAVDVGGQPLARLAAVFVHLAFQILLRITNVEGAGLGCAVVEGFGSRFGIGLLGHG